MKKASASQEIIGWRTKILMNTAANRRGKVDARKRVLKSANPLAKRYCNVSALAARVVSFIARVENQ